MFFPFSWIFGSLLDSNPVDCLLQGAVGACGVSILCNLIRVHHFRQLSSQWKTSLQFWSLALLLSLVGPRVSSLIVLEFILRALSAWATAESHNTNLNLLLVQCLFSLGCGLTCTLVFIHQGAPHSTLGLILAAALSWTLASVSLGLWRHVAKLYPLHSTKGYCGKCISILASGHNILTTLQKVVIWVFALAAVVSTATVYEHFLSQKGALKFWTPLTLCYSMLVVCIQEGQNRQTVTKALIHAVVVRLGATLVLMLTVGDWTDVLHVLIAFLGEAVCLVHSQDILHVVLKEAEEESSNPITNSEDSLKSNPTRKHKISLNDRQLGATALSKT